MPTAIDRERVRQLLGEGAQLVEVLPRAEYEDEHLPDAISSGSSTASASSSSSRKVR